MDHYPIMKEWELYFDKKDGLGNRETVAKAFYDFWKEPTAKQLIMPGRCGIGGNVFNHHTYSDNEMILSSRVISIDSIKRSDYYGIPHDLMCANTATGSKYYFYSNEYNTFMFIMIGDLVRLGHLNPNPNYYLGPEFRNKGFI